MIIKKLLQVQLVSVLLLIIFTKCEFQPGDISETFVKPPDEAGPDLYFSLNNYTDTIKMGWKRDFIYQLGGTDKRIRSLSIKFEGNELLHQNAGGPSTFTFSLDPQPYNNGNYNLCIKIIVDTESGSIADKTGAEGYLYELYWPVYIDKTLPSGPNNYLIKATRSEKGVELNWPAFNHPNCSYYLIYRQVIPYKLEVIDTIRNPAITHITDTTFWEGQESTYHLEIKTPQGIFRANSTKIVTTYTGELQTLWQTDGTVYVSWDKAKNLESFGKYYVYSGYSTTNIIEEHFIDNPDQNHVTLQRGGMGLWLHVYLKFIPKEVPDAQYSSLKSMQTEVRPKQVLPAYESAFDVNNRDFVLLAGSGKIYRYFPHDIRTEDSISVNLSSTCMLSVSNNGEKFACFDNGSFYIRKCDDFTVEKVFPAPSFEAAKSSLKQYSLSDNGMLIVLDNKGIIYKLNTDDGLIVHIDTLKIKNYPLNFAIISPDGTKMAGYTGNPISPVMLYTFSPEGWKETGSSSVIPSSTFYSKDGTSLFIAGWSELEKRRVADFTLLSYNTFSNFWFNSADPDHDRFLWLQGELGVISDLNTGLTLKTVQIGLHYGCTLNDNHIICNPGLQLTLPEFK